MADKSNKTQNDHAYYAFGIRIMLDMGLLIAIPAVLAAFGGTYLDEKFDKYPLFLILCLVNAFVISAKVIMEKAKKYGKEFDALDKK
ncbi:MAG: AtpZ/AtpI family protein [Patescibacteria group bacterium]